MISIETQKTSLERQMQSTAERGELWDFEVRKIKELEQAQFHCSEATHESEEPKRNQSPVLPNYKF